MKSLALRVGIIATALGILIVLLSMGGATTHECAQDSHLETFCQDVEHLPNQGGIGFGAFFAILGTLSLNLWLISVFLIQTSKSIIEGMGGNFATPVIVKAEKPTE